MGSQQGAFDLPAIITGVVVVGVLTAGVLASIFGVIPYTQDNGAKQDAAAVRTAEGVARAKDGKFLDTAGLIASGYIPAAAPSAAGPGGAALERVSSSSPTSFAVSVNDAGTCYVAVTKSGTGKIFYVTDVTSEPAVLTPASDTGCLPGAQVNTLVGAVGGFPASYIPGTPANLTGAVSTPASVTFTWDAAAMATGYKVESRINGGTWKTESESQPGRSVTVAGGYNSTVSVRVSAMNAAGISAPVEAAATLPADPGFSTLTVSKQGGVTGQPSWRSLASSADGMKLVAGRYDNSSLYTSADGGKTWTLRNVLGNTGMWESVASSSDGTHLIAALYGGFTANDGKIFTSYDSGNTWTQRANTGTNWDHVASSGDGRVLFAANEYYYMGAISTDYGVTWRQPYIGGSKYIQDAAISADGSVMMVGTTSALYLSKDEGKTWTQQTQTGAGSFSGMAVSSDGSTLIAGTSASTGSLFVSHDHGVTWTRNDQLAPMSWSGMTSSADGSKLAAAGGNKIYTSVDSGATWKLQNGFGTGSFRYVDSSADGKKIFADDYTGPIYTGTYGP